MTAPLSAPAPNTVHLPVETTLDRCIKCGICVTACPVSAVTDRFPGPKYVGPQAARLRQPWRAGAPRADLDNGLWVRSDDDDGHLVPDHSVDYCSGCRACNMACPTGVRIAEINARARAAMVEGAEFGWRKRLRNNLLARPELLGGAGYPVGRLVNAAFENRFARALAEGLLDIDRRAPLPRYQGERFAAWHRRHQPPPATRGKVAYFTGCATAWYEARIGRAAVGVLERLGFKVVVPEQNCCGLPLLSNGEFPAARKYHRGNVEKLIGFAERGIPIVGTSTSCTLTLKEEAPELLDAFAPDESAVAAATYDICEFIAGLLVQGDLGLDLLPIPLRLGYHPPCQYRAHRIGLPALDLMEMVPDLEVELSPATCCGIAGTYGYKSEKYEIAMAVGAPLFKFVKEVGGPVAISDSETCRWQITHGTDVPAVHPIEVIAASLGLAVEDPLAAALRSSGVPEV
jgi:glycerol-3-phosphate dehydrogenase subunit C